MRACVIDAQQKRVDLSYIQSVFCRKKFLSFGCSSTRMCRIDTHTAMLAQMPPCSLSTYICVPRADGLLSRRRKTILVAGIVTSPILCVRLARAAAHDRPRLYILSSFVSLPSTLSFGQSSRTCED